MWQFRVLESLFKFDARLYTAIRPGCTARISRIGERLRQTGTLASSTSLCLGVVSRACDDVYGLGDAFVAISSVGVSFHASGKTLHGY